MDGPVHFFAVMWPYALVIAPGLFAVWRQLKSDNRQSASDRGALVKIAHDVALGIIQVERDEIADLRKRLKEIETELVGLRKEHAEMLILNTQRIAFLEGEKRQLQAKVDAYEDLLRRHDIPVPKVSATYWRLEDGEMKPQEQRI